MRKAIVIASAIISILLSGGMIVLLAWAGIKNTSSLTITFSIPLAIFLFVALISAAVLFSIKLNRPLMVLSVIMAMIIGLGSTLLFLAMAVTFILYPELPFLYALVCLGFVTITITCITYIRMVMKSAGNQEAAKRWPFKTKAGPILAIGAVLAFSFYFIINRDNDSLHKALEGVDRIKVRSGGTCHRNTTDEKVLIDEKRPEFIQNIIKNINVGTNILRHVSCACCGNPTFEFYKKDQLVISLGFHHGKRLRWPDGKWAGDAELTKSSAAFLAKLLAEAKEKK
ncbi:MAG: hypothetical protein HZA49_10305 [Planctomycetes bacterium]|nr:hypothetical protein [Planctomycetota bacterium]